MARGAEHAGPAVTGAFDFRVTRVGAFLRRTKLDELPQLVNVSWPADDPGRAPTRGARATSSGGVPRSARSSPCARASPARRRSPTSTRRRSSSATRRGVRAPAHARQARDRPRLRPRATPCAATSRILARTAVGDPGRRTRRARTRPRRYTFAERLAAARPGPLLLDAILAALAAALAVGLRIDRNNIFAAVGHVLGLRAARRHRAPGDVPDRRRVPPRLALPDRLRRGARRLVARRGVADHDDA